MTARPNPVNCAPQGYPKVGLVARSLVVPHHKTASARRLRTNVETWEKQQGLIDFSFRSMDTVPPELAQEAAPSYVDLASEQMSLWYATVKPDSQPLAVATTYEFLAPLRVASPIRQHPDAALAAVSKTDPARELCERAVVSAAELQLRDVWSSGGIDLCLSFASRRAYNELLSLRSRSAAPLPGRPPRVVPHQLGVLGYSLVHEFGHLVEAELLVAGPEATSYVYGELSKAILDLQTIPRPSQWSTHLVNYPEVYTARPSARITPKTREMHVRATTGVRISHVLGEYAARTRGELFAEAFVAMWASSSPELLKRMVRVRHALTEVGLAVSRRPSKVV